MGWRRIVQSVLVYKEGVQGAVSVSGWIGCANQNLGATLEIPAPLCRPPKTGRGDSIRRCQRTSLNHAVPYPISMPVLRVRFSTLYKHLISQASGKSDKEMTRLNRGDTIRHFTTSLFWTFSIARGYIFLLFSKSRLARGSQVLPAPAANTAWEQKSILSTTS